MKQRDPDTDPVPPRPASSSGLGRPDTRGGARGETGRPETRPGVRREGVRPGAQPSFPPSSFWKTSDDEPGGSHTGLRDKEIQAHKDALAGLDQELESLRNTPLPRPGRALRYILYFLLFTCLLSVRDFRIFYSEAGDLLALQRLYPSDYGGAIPGAVQNDLQKRAEDLAREIDVEPKAVEDAQEIIHKVAFTQRRERIGLLNWGIVLQFGDKAFLFGYNIFLNMLYAAGLATVLFLRNREIAQSKLIDRQNRELFILNRRQSLEMEETSRLLHVLSRAQSRLLASEKLASIGRLSATLAHEIRNPLGIIASSVGMVAEDLNPSTPSGQALDLVRHEIHRLNKIITDLLDFARPQIPNPNYFDPNDLLREWTRPLEEEMAERNIRLLAELDPAPPEIYVDPDQLYQAFLNLVFNAADAMEENGGGDITVTTRAESSDLVAIEVIDNGRGMAKDLLGQVFEPFFTTKTTGSGLGLAVVKQTIEGMGGTTAIESVVGEGTRVRLLLPTGPSAIFAGSRLEESEPGPAADSLAEPADTTTDATARPAAP